MSISASTQIPDRKPADKTEISREQHSKEANIKKVEVAKSYTKNDGLPNGFQNARYIHKQLFKISAATFENVCRLTYETRSSLDQKCVYHCCVLLIFDQTTMNHEQKHLSNS